jgi:hypothetical protein
MATVTQDNNSETEESESKLPMLAVDTLVYLVLGVVLWGAWRFTQLGIFEPGDDVGYWLGVAGGVMMLFLLLYPLRKYIRTAHSWGSMRFWFFIHMLFGIIGPLLILVHSNFHTGSLNAAVAYYSMLIVAGSGIAGRFLYVRVHRNLRHEREALDEFRSRVRLDQTEVRSRLAFAPEVEAMIRDFEAKELAARQTGAVALTRKVVWLPISRWFLHQRCVKALKVPIRKLAAHGKWSEAEFKRRERKGRIVINEYSQAIVRVCQHSAYERLFSLWHVAHIPFVYMLAVSALVHVLAVHMY